MQTDDEYSIAATNSTISIQMVGSLGESEWLLLNNGQQNKYAQGSIDEFYVIAKDVGELLLIRLSNI